MSIDKLTDLTYLKSLSDGNDGFVEKMLSVYLKQTPESVNNLEMQLLNKDWRALKSTSHKLKASFMFIGVNELPDLINSVEEFAATETHLDLLPEMIFKIKDISCLIMKELELERNSKV